VAPEIVGLLGIGAAFLLLAMGVHIGFVLGGVGFLGLVSLVGLKASLGALAMVPYSTASSYMWIVAPLFVFMGSLAFHAEIADRFFLAARKWLGASRGGLAIASIVGCAGFAAASGSSVVTAATIGRVAVPEMRKYGYDARLATGTVAAGGTLGMLIPPSVGLVIYSMLTGAPLGKLLLGGFIPGVLSAAVYAASIWVRVKLRPELAPGLSVVGLKERFASLKGVWPVLALLAFVIGGIYTGIVTPTEAAAVGAFGALMIALVLRTLTPANLKESLSESAQTTAMLFAVLIGAFIFSRFLAVSRLPTQMSELVVGLRVPPIGILVASLIPFLILGAFIDVTTMKVLMIPILFPAIEAAGINSIVWGIMIIKLAEIGMITPPFGLNVYVLQSVTGVPLEDIFRGIGWFLVMDFLTVGLLITFPRIILFVPDMMK
jgi:tripartite ATP-independent transporter DctM subunit